MKLKVCGNANVENLSGLLELQPDYVGFIFHPPSVRYMGNDAAFIHYIATISNTQKVGVFVNADASEIAARTEACKLDMVQLHGDESPEFCLQIAATIPVIKAFGISEGFDFNSLQAYRDSCAYFLFDTATALHGGSGKTFDWTLLSRYRLDTPFFLSGGISAGHTAVLKSIPHPALAGIDVNSRFELSPGIKNIPDLKTFFHEIRN
jgi:phosphoribosylanthranilate isomerase